MSLATPTRIFTRLPRFARCFFSPWTPSSPELQGGLAHPDAVARSQLGGRGHAPLVEIGAVGGPQVLDVPGPFPVEDARVGGRRVRVGQSNVAGLSPANVDGAVESMGLDLRAALVRDHDRPGCFRGGSRRTGRRR